MATMVLDSAQSAEGDVADEALELLGVTSISQESDTQAWVRAAKAAQRVFDELSGRGYAPFPSDAIPEWAQDAIIALTAKKLLPMFAVPAERAALVIAAANGAIKELVAQIALNRPGPQTMIRMF